MDEASTSVLIPNTSVGHLIRKLVAMCKKPSLESDLSGVLDEYLKKLRESQIYLNNGIFTTSFTEAALLIDNAVLLYSKKLDILWDNLFDYQKQLLSCERKTEKTQQAELRLEERRQKYKRRKKAVRKEEGEVMDEATVDRIVEGVVRRLEEVGAAEFTLENDANLLARCDAAGARFVPKQMAAKPFAPYSRAGFVTMDHLICGDDEDFMCDNWYLLTERKLFLLPEHVRQIRYNFFKRRNIELVGYDVCDKLLQQFIVEKDVADLEGTRDMSLLINAYVKLHLDLRRRQDISVMQEYKKLSLRRPSVLLTRLPDDVLQHYLKKDDADFPSSSQSPGGRDEQEGKTLLEHQRNQGDSGFFDESFLNDTAEQNTDAHTDNDVDNNAEDLFGQVVTSTPKSSSRQDPRIQNRTFELRPRKRKLKVDEDDEELLRLLKRLPRRGHRPFKWLRTFTTKLKTFERFYHFNYEPESGEGEILECEFSDSEPDEPEDNTEMAEQTSEDVPQDVNEPSPSSSAEAGAKSKLMEYENVLPVVQDPYVEWRNFIERKLASSDKTDFDIHKYGTDVLSGIPETEPVHFDSLMRGKKSSDVVRYFIASLQLANTYNIELIHSNRAQMGNDDLKVKFLSRERYHENLSTYHAPSEVNLPKKLDQMRALTMAMSAPSFSTGCKRRKLCY